MAYTMCTTVAKMEKSETKRRDITEQWNMCAITIPANIKLIPTNVSGWVSLLWRACSRQERVWYVVLPGAAGPQEDARPAWSPGQETQGCDWAPAEKLTPQADASCFWQVDFPCFSAKTKNSHYMCYSTAPLQLFISTERIRQKSLSGRRLLCCDDPQSIALQMLEWFTVKHEMKKQNFLTRPPLWVFFSLSLCARGCGLSDVSALAMWGMPWFWEQMSHGLRPPSPGPVRPLWQSKLREALFNDLFPFRLSVWNLHRIACLTLCLGKTKNNPSKSSVNFSDPFKVQLHKYIFEHKVSAAADNMLSSQSKVFYCPLATCMTMSHFCIAVSQYFDASSHP